MSGVSTNSIALATMAGDTLKCDALINIPGEPAVLVGDQLVTQDSYSKDSQVVSKEYEQNGKKVVYQQLQTVPAYGYTVVQLKGKAVLGDLSDEMNTKYGVMTSYTVPGENVLYFLNGSDESRETRLSSLQVENGRLVSTASVLADIEGYTSMMGLVKTAAGDKVAVIRGNDGVRLFKWKGIADRPAAISFKPVREDGTVGASTSKWDGYVYGTVHYSPDLNSVEISAGLTGLVQLYL